MALPRGEWKAPRGLTSCICSSIRVAFGHHRRPRPRSRWRRRGGRLRQDPAILSRRLGPLRVARQSMLGAVAWRRTRGRPAGSGADTLAAIAGHSPHSPTARAAPQHTARPSEAGMQHLQRCRVACCIRAGLRVAQGGLVCRPTNIGLRPTNASTVGRSVRPTYHTPHQRHTTRSRAASTRLRGWALHHRHGVVHPPTRLRGRGPPITYGGVTCAPDWRHMVGST